MALEAQESNSNKINCPACQASNAKKAKVCAVCGTPLHVPKGEMDSAIYQDLGRANLYRMRGQTKEAIDLCLSILRKAPNNITAHSLLGDIYYDQDDLRQAAEWYELASQLDPTAEREKQLLERIRNRIESSDHLQTLEQLGVQESAPPVRRYLYGGIALIVVVGVLAFFAGNAVQPNSMANKPLVNPITVPQNPNASQLEPNVVVDSSERNSIANDMETLALLKQGQRKDFLLDAIQIVDTEEIIMTVRFDSTYPASVNALFAASDVFTLRPNTMAATIRVIKDQRIYFSGQVTRQAYDEAQALSSQSDPNFETIAAQAFPTAFNASPTNVTVPPPVANSNTTEATKEETPTKETTPKLNQDGE